MQWTVLRPCHIYGPGSLLGCLPLHGRDADLLDKMKAGHSLQLVGGGHFLQQPIFAADLAELTLSCYGQASSYGQIFCGAFPLPPHLRPGKIARRRPGRTFHSTGYRAAPSRRKSTIREE
jgi:hypothetical protein